MGKNRASPSLLKHSGYYVYLGHCWSVYRDSQGLWILTDGGVLKEFKGRTTLSMGVDVSPREERHPGDFEEGEQ